MSRASLYHRALNITSVQLMCKVFWLNEYSGEKPSIHASIWVGVFFFFFQLESENKDTRM